MGKSATKLENRNIAVAVTKDDLFKIGKEHYFILVSKNAKSAGQSVVGGSETNQKRVIQMAVSQIVGVQTQRLRLGGANAKLSPEFNQFKFDSADPVKRIQAMSAVVAKAALGVVEDVEFLANPVVIVATRLIQYRIQHFDMTDMPPNTRKRRQDGSFLGEGFESAGEDEGGRAMDSAAPRRPVAEASVVRSEDVVLCDDPSCNFQFIDPRAKFCRKCRTEKRRHITCVNCSAVCIFTSDLVWCDFCGQNVFEASMRVSDEGLRDEA
jgi:hypothetical protein